mmetsp:Transcript_40705/g.110036  ORF Transcript_40705/g.110036 Transcript_40705/m.110036 type:complete len:248 (-) Transcript_40705:435-1178(-)
MPGVRVPRRCYNQCIAVMRMSAACCPLWSAWPSKMRPPRRSTIGRTSRLGSHGPTTSGTRSSTGPTSATTTRTLHRVPSPTRRSRRSLSSATRLAGAAWPWSSANGGCSRSWTSACPAQRGRSGACPSLVAQTQRPRAMWPCSTAAQQPPLLRAVPLRARPPAAPAPRPLAPPPPPQMAAHRRRQLRTSPGARRPNPPRRCPRRSFLRRSGKSRSWTRIGGSAAFLWYPRRPLMTTGLRCTSQWPCA